MRLKDNRSVTFRLVSRQTAASPPPSLYPQMLSQRQKMKMCFSVKDINILILNIWSVDNMNQLHLLHCKHPAAAAAAADEGRQAKQDFPDVPLTSGVFQLLLGDPEGYR